VYYFPNTGTHCAVLCTPKQVSMKVRNPYVDPLNVLQAEIMKRLRKDTAAVAGGVLQTDSQKEQRITLEDALIVSVNGIAQGMKNSG
jgi:phosphoenolpyruvate carboxylase